MASQSAKMESLVDQTVNEALKRRKDVDMDARKFGAQEDLAANAKKTREFEEKLAKLEHDVRQKDRNLEVLKTEIELAKNNEKSRTDELTQERLQRKETELKIED